MRLKGTYALILILLVLVLVAVPASGYDTAFQAIVTGNTLPATHNLTFADLLAANGATSSWTGTTFTVDLEKQTIDQENTFYKLSAGVTTFDTSSIPDDAIIESAELIINPTTVLTDLGSSWGVVATNYNGVLANATNGSVGSLDYQKKLNVDESNRISASSFSVGQNATFTLNAAGKANVSKTSPTVLYLQLTDAVDGAFTGVWVSGDAKEGLIINSYRATDLTKRPELRVVYNEVAPVAAFSADDVTPTIGQTVTFTDASVNATSWQWDFGDGSSSTDQNPAYVYNQSGAFTVKLTVTNVLGSDAEEKASYITVSTATPACPLDLHTMYNVTGDGTDEFDKLQAAFDYTRTQGACKVTFPADSVIRINQSGLNMSEYLELDGQNATIMLSDSYYNASHAEIVIRTADNDWWHNLNYHGNYPGPAPDLDPAMQVSVRNGVLIEDSSFRNMSQYGLEAYGKADWIIRNNYFENCRQYCVATGGGSGGFSENGTVEFNTIINAAQPGIKIRGTANSTISSNTIWVPNPGQWGSGTGIRLYSADKENLNVLIINNTIEGDYIRTTNNDYAYGISSDNNANTGCNISGNRINSTYVGLAISGITSDNKIVIGNTVTNSSYTGLRVQTNGTQFLNNNVDGILLGIAANTFPDSNIFRGNIISPGIPGIKAGANMKNNGLFFWYNVTNTTIDFNRITVDQIGININGTAASIQNGTTVTNNIITAGICIVDGGTSTVQTNNTCNGAMDPVIVSFTGVQSVPSVGKKQVVFTDTSTGPTVLSRIWTATEIVNSTPVEIGTTTPLTVTFGPGNYSIVLNASAAIEANSTADNAYWVNVSASDSSSVPIAAFSANATTVCYGATVAFTDQSTNTSSWTWVFGDGATSTTQNPEHTYNISSGYFTVALTASNGIGSDTETKTNYIEVQASCSGGDTTPSTHPFSAATGSSMITTALGILGLALIGFGAAIVIGAFTTQSTDGLIAGIFTIMLGGAILIISYMFLSPIMNLVA